MTAESLFLPSALVPSERFDADPSVLTRRSLERRWFFVSLLFHLLVVAAILFALGPRPVPPNLPVIKITLVREGPGSEGAAGGGGGHGREAGAAAAPPAPEAAATPPEAAAPAPTPEPPAPTVQTVEPVPAPPEPVPPEPAPATPAVPQPPVQPAPEAVVP